MKNDPRIATLERQLVDAEQQVTALRETYDADAAPKNFEAWRSAEERCIALDTKLDTLRQKDADRHLNTKILRFGLIVMTILLLAAWGFSDLMPGIGYICGVLIFLVSISLILPAVANS